ncbi:hypothetical protein FKP32DRAFT_1658028 [Trametes sanguinea]|nr:hypothetical protein FKP32DRAFT_1658028 [Trametes sanguinea]
MKLVNKAIAPMLWAKELAAVAARGLDKQVREHWRFIPESVDKMYDWAIVVGDDSEEGTLFSRAKYLVYKSPEVDDGAMCTVTILLQGFIKECALSPLGNWSGHPKDAQGAVQRLVLESRGCDIPFGAQLRALKDIRQFITMSVGAEVDPKDGEVNVIVLSRRVFTKVRPVGEQPAAIRLTDATDPFRRARKIADKWRIDHIVKTMVRRGTGDDVPVAYDALVKGDFVEVAAVAHIEVARSRKYRGSYITFEMHEVVRLMSARDVEVSPSGGGWHTLLNHVVLGGVAQAI